ncbi:MAG: signal recognition particle [Solibacillus sp.]|uniref:signal recognition particle n=1 Tax=Solibacillus sp. TaxID=1909654 RepID=UPI00331585D7
MFDDEKLSQLKKIQVDPEKKEEDFNKIQQRLNSKPFHWQIPAVIIAIACITLFLVGTFPPKQQITSDNMDSNSLQAVYYMQWEGDPESTLQAGVKKVKDEETLMEMESLLKQLVQTDIQVQDPHIYQSYRLQFEDNRTMRLQEYHGSEVMYYRDIGTGQIYLSNENSLQEIINLHEPADRNLSLIIGIVLITLLLFATNELRKKMRDPDDPKRYIPMHSTYWQSTVEILSVLILLLFIFASHLHLFQLIAFLVLSALINILLEVKHGKNKWRIVQFLLWKLYAGAYMYLILWL